MWVHWVGQLRPIYGEIWREVGIYDAIITSIFVFHKDEDLVLGLAESWCTFMFCWGEATITLEDMMLLGDFSILGLPVTDPLTGKLLELQNRMSQEHKDLGKSKTHKASPVEWINRFVGKDDELEHVTFLSFWLSRFIFATYPNDTIDKVVFPVAIHLSRGIRIALALAVLASLYRDLAVFKEEMEVSFVKSECSSEETDLTLWAPFQFMQLWAWERFLSLQPVPVKLHFVDTRAARWHDCKTKSKMDSVRVSSKIYDHFQWRPYSCVLENWQHPLYDSKQGEGEINPRISEELLAFSRCFLSSELVGWDCIAQYVPHRVGRQFGFDQDIPSLLARENAKREIAWRTYDKPLKNISCYIPPSFSESGVTTKYFTWWNQSSSTMGGEF